MAEVKETVVFEVDVSAYEQSLVGLTKTINELKVQQKDFQEQTKKGVEGAAVAYEKVTAQLKVQQQEYRTTQAVLVGVEANKKKLVDTTNFENNSIQANRDLLKQLTAQYINVQKPTAEFTDRIKKLSDTLKQQEGAIGDTRRNVGNYFNEFAKGIPIISQAVDPIKNIAAGFKNAGGGAAGLSAALGSGLLAVIPLVTSAVGSVIDVFKDYKPVADAVEDATAAMSAGFRAFVLGRDVEEAANQAIEYTRALRDLEDSQEIFNVTLAEGENLINRNILASKNSLATIEERKEALAAASRAEKSLLEQELGRVDKELDSNQKIIVSRGKLTEAQRVQYRFGTEAQRIAIRGLLEQRGVEEKFIDSFEKGITKRTQLEGKSLELRQKIANRLAAIEEKEQKDNEKKAQDREKILEKQQKDLENYNKNIESLSDAFLLNDRQRLEKSFNDKLATIKGQSQAELDLIFAIEQDKQAALEKFDDDAIKKGERTAKELARIRIEALQTGLEKELSLYELSFTAREEGLRKAGLTEVQIEDVKQREINEIRERYAAKHEEIEQGKYIRIAKLQEEANQKMADNARQMQMDEGDAIVQMVTDISNAISDVLSSVSAFINQAANENIEALNQQVKAGAITQQQFAAETRAIKLKAWKESKAIAITQAVMNTANAVMAQLSNPTPYVGIVLAALAAATGALQIALIAKQQPPKFKAGGGIPIDGKSHEHGGTPIHVNGELVAEAEKGEGLFVMKKDAYQDLHMLSTWNQKYGGRSWLGGGIKFAQEGGKLNLPTSDGGFATREISNQVQTTELMAAAIRDGFTKAPAPELSIVEFTTKTKRRNRSVNISEL